MQQTLDLSPLGLFLNASLVGKAVMAVLFLASLWSWVLIIEGRISVMRLRSAVRKARAGGEISKSLIGVVIAGDEETRRRIPGETVGELRSRISDAMARAARDLLTRSEGGLPNLAVISSVAPFVGLFGTVWGIMSSFAAIGQAQDTSLATVAPGIAERSQRPLTASRRQFRRRSVIIALARPLAGSDRIWPRSLKNARWR